MRGISSNIIYMTFGLVQVLIVCGFAYGIGYVVGVDDTKKNKK